MHLWCLMFACALIDWDMQTFQNAKREAARQGKPLVVFIGKDNPPSEATMDAIDAFFCWVEKLPGFEQPCVLILRKGESFARKLPAKETTRRIKLEVENPPAPVKLEPRGALPAYPRGPARGC